MNHPLEIGSWRQISVLGSGAFGHVMLWKHETTGDFVAIKKCKFQKASSLSARQRERWNSEVDFMKSVDHPNIIKFINLPQDFENVLQKYNPTKLPLLSMEYCNKGNLRRYMLNERVRLCGLFERDVRDVVRDVSSGLRYLHSKNITHRDIKPENIVLQQGDNRTIYKIIDLGYAKELQDTNVSFVGTLHYLAPEIFTNRKYDCTVDYWSMGLLVFEVVCGILPFLPEMNPFESYPIICQKRPDDICIYMNYSGAVASSSEMKKENFISSCLKQNLETWLRQVLQVDPSKRCFSSLDVFEYLHFILDKKVVKVFSVYKLEFYSYEINDGTLLGTLKDWISRDIKVPKNDLILLFAKENSFGSNDDAILNDLVDEETLIYAFKKGFLISDGISFTVPKLVQELLKVAVPFQIKQMRNLIRQALFFVYSENLAVNSLREGFDLYLKYLELIFKQVKEKHEIAFRKLTSILEKIQSILRDRGNKQCDLDTQLKECLNNFKRLLSSFERSRDKFKEFSREVIVLAHLQGEIDDLKVELEGCFKQCNIEELFTRINSKNFFELNNGETSKDMLKCITKVVSETLKLKTKFVHRNEKLKNCGKDFGIVLTSAEQLLLWVENYLVHINELLDVFEQTDSQYQTLIARSVKKGMYCNLEENDRLIEENREIRFRFEDVLSKSVLAHKNYVKDSSDFLG